MKDWLTVSEAAEVVGMTRQNLYKHLYDGRLRAAETKHGWIIDPQSAEEYRDARKRSSRRRPGQKIVEPDARDLERDQEPSAS